jgi:hypothetical protein
MMWDLAALTHLNIIGFNNDAKGCFDRKIPIIAALVCRRQGLPKTVVDTFLDVLYGMQYRIRTALGLSDEVFSNLTTLVLGTMQGAGWSMMAWIMMTVILLALLCKRSNGVKFVNPHKMMEIK